MPRKIRELVRDLNKAGWLLDKGGKGSHRKFVHPEIARKLILSGQDGADAKRYQEKRRATSHRRSQENSMKTADAYLAWVEWDEEDGVYVGRCPDLFIGGCHGDDPVQVYAELRAIVDEEVASYQNAGKPLPIARTRPLVAA